MTTESDMRGFITTLFGLCLVSMTPALASDQIEDQVGLEFFACDDGQDIWRCQPPSMDYPARLVDWEPGDEVLTLDLSPRNYGLIEVHEVDAITGASHGVLWSGEGGPEIGTDPIRVEVARPTEPNRALRVEVRKSSQSGGYLVQDIDLPFEGTDEVTFEFGYVDGQDGPTLPVPRVFTDPDPVLCNIESDPWQCRPPIIRGFVHNSEAQSILSLKGADAYGLHLPLGLDVENAADVVVEEVHQAPNKNERLYQRRWTIHDLDFPPANGPRLHSFFLRLLSSENTLEVTATNPHGTTKYRAFYGLDDTAKPTLTKAEFVTYKGPNATPVTEVDSFQEVNLRLNGLKFTDNALIRLSGTNQFCPTPVFAKNNGSEIRHDFGENIGKTTADGNPKDLKIILLNCPGGRTNTIRAEVELGQVNYFPPGQAFVTPGLTVSSQLAPKPRILHHSLSAQGWTKFFPNGGYPYGAPLTMKVEVLDADVVRAFNSEFKVESGPLASGIQMVLLNLPANYKATGGFDVEAETKNNPTKDSVRYLIDVKRKAKLTVPFRWEGFDPTKTTHFKVICKLESVQNPAGSVGYLTQSQHIALNGKGSSNMVLSFTFEEDDNIRFEKIKSDTIRHECEGYVFASDFTEKGSATVGSNTSHTYGAWALPWLTFKTDPLVIRKR